MSTTSKSLFLISSMKRPRFRTYIIWILIFLILIFPVQQEKAHAVEPISLTVAFLNWAAVWGAIGGGQYLVECLVFNREFNGYDFAGHITASALKGMAIFAKAVFPPSVLIIVLGAADVQGVTSAFGDRIGNFFEVCVSCMSENSNFTDIKNCIINNLAEFDNRFGSTVEALNNANGSVPVNPFEPMWADFKGSSIDSSNMSIYTDGMEYNSFEGASWRMLYPGTSCMQAIFNLPDAANNIILSLTHLTSANSGAPGGGYSPIDIYINDQLFLDNYDVAQHHCGSHGYETDLWQIEQYLVTGQNTIIISFEDNPWAYTHYWIQNLAINCGNIDETLLNYRLTPSAGTHGDIEPSGISCIAAGNSKTFYAYPDNGYIVDKWYVNGQVVVGSEGQTSFTLSNIQQDTYVTVLFKPGPQPAGLNIITPTAGDYAKGHRMYIGWEATGLTGNVKIELLQNGALYDIIEDSVSVSMGHYTWNMSYDIPNGDNYTIKISSLSSSTVDESEVFSIVDAIPYGIPTYIATLEDLQKVSSGQSGFEPNRHYILVNDIDASSVANFVPIGIDESRYFSGIFDGQNHTIINVQIDRPDEVVGLFKVLRNDGTIKNLILEHGSIRGRGIVGALVGESAGTVINCHSSARVRTITETNGATDTSGGLIGRLQQGTLLNSSTEYYNDYSGVVSESDEVGGLVGHNFDGSIKWCWSSSRRADGEGMVKVGGIAGFNSGVIEECYTKFTLETRGESHVGGVAGQNMGTIRNSYCGSKVRGETGYNTGGIVGNNDGGTVEKCYNYGTIDSSGGGGLVGRNYGCVLNSFWDTATSGVTQPVGSGDGCIINCYGLLTAEMKQQNTYTSTYSANWDFDNIWTIDEGVDYPSLRGAKRSLETPPSGVNASNDQPSKITITWNAVADASAYRIYRCDSVDGVFNPITTWLTGSLSYQDTSVIPDATFYYKVKAAYTVNGAGESEFSNPDDGMCTFQLPQPTNVSATQNLMDFVFVQWETVVGANYYRVYRSETEAGTKTAISDWTDSLAFFDTTAVPDSSYYYWVVASSDSSGTGQSDYAGPAIGALPNPNINGEGIVNLLDFLILSRQWKNTPCTAPNWCERADIDHSGSVDSDDLLIFVEHWLEGTQNEPSDMVWVAINNDPGVSGHEGFDGQMSKYETTNAQYCQFLNEAIATGDITVSGDSVLGANGTNVGADYVGQVYYDLAGPGVNNYGATNGGAVRINYSEGVFNVDSGFENHPVTHVSWYGATAFCNYYGYRLPTEWEWQAVADYDGSYTYGCGTTINNNMANYLGSVHPDGTTIVGAFGTYGYGICDMAGNVFEWTSTLSGSNYILRGGVWRLSNSYCRVDYRSSNGAPSDHSNNDGFRVCR